MLTFKSQHFDHFQQKSTKFERGFFKKPARRRARLFPRRGKCVESKQKREAMEVDTSGIFASSPSRRSAGVVSYTQSLNLSVGYEVKSHDNEGGTALPETPSSAARALYNRSPRATEHCRQKNPLEAVD